MILTRIEKESLPVHLKTAGRDLISPRSSSDSGDRLPGVPVSRDLGGELERLERRLRPLHLRPPHRWEPLILRLNNTRRSKIASAIELRRATSPFSGRRRRRRLKVLGWAAVAALTCFIVAVSAGLVHGDIHRPKIWPGPPPEVERLRNGWGEPASFVGQYHVRFLKSVGANRSSGYAEYAGERFREGHLTMFMREVFEHKPLVPGGVLVLNGPVHNLVLYLAELSSNGGRVLYATVKGGTYEGPAVGSFGGVKRGNRIFGGMRLRGLANVEADFIRYSRNPDTKGPSGSSGTVLP